MAIIPQEEKVFMVSNSTNTTYSGSAALKAMQQWYTMQDVTDTVKPYKVYTALLTQSGEDNQETLIDEPLTIGVTYKIGDQAGGTWDFTNVGAPNNDIDTYFVATGTTPNSWGNGTLIYNEGAPIVTVLENTIGNIYWIYDSTGVYKAVGGAGTFEDGKFGLIQGAGNSSSLVSLWSYNASVDSSEMLLECYDLGNVSISFETKNDILVNQLIEIRVYN